MTTTRRVDDACAKKQRSQQDSNLRGQSPVDFWSTPLTAWLLLLLLLLLCCVSHGVVVSTQDPESCDRGSNPRGRTFSTGRVAQGIAPGSPTQKRDLRRNRTAVVGFGIRSATATP